MQVINISTMDQHRLVNNLFNKPPLTLYLNYEATLPTLVTLIVNKSPLGPIYAKAYCSPVLAII